MVSQIKVNEIIKQSGSSITIGESGDTISLTGNTVNLGTTGNTVNIAGATYADAAASNTPSFYAYSSSAQVINSDSYTLASCETELWDTDSAYDTSTYTFTVPSGKGGKYNFYFGGELEAFGASGKYYRALLYKNGSAMTSPDIANVIHFGGDSGDVDAQNDSIALLLSASDTVQFRVFQNRGQNKNLYGGFYFSGFRISS
jgi:hypothetical protein